MNQLASQELRSKWNLKMIVTSLTSWLVQNQLVLYVLLHLSAHWKL
jgi:hypothetical protein